MEKFTIKRKIVVEEEVGYNRFVALKIIDERKRMGLTQDEFANKIGLSRASVVNIEKGRQQVSLKNLYLICKYLEIKSSALLPF